jgi:DtxR family Mn-dependent transcriptional regulator
MNGHRQEMANQEVEELVESIWTLGEEGRSSKADLRNECRITGFDEAFAELLERGLVREQGDRIELTREGRKLAERQVRRHRLAEVLFTTVFQVKDDRDVNRTACVMEHVIGPGMTNSICAFLGHPSACPHGKPIPPGTCCQSFSTTVEPLVQPLTRLTVGQRGRIVFVVSRDSDRVVRLASLGVIPGATLQLQQRSPAAVIRLGETTLAVDPDIAADVYVKRL